MREKLPIERVPRDERFPKSKNQYYALGFGTGVMMSIWIVNAIEHGTVSFDSLYFFVCFVLFLVWFSIFRSGESND